MRPRLSELNQAKSNNAKERKNKQWQGVGEIDNITGVNQRPSIFRNIGCF